MDVLLFYYLSLTMFHLLPLPIYTFLRFAVSSGGFRLRQFGRVVLWLSKIILVEPFRWIELLTYRRRIHRSRLTHDPIFVLGYHRSGTSYLHQMLIQDDRFGYHTYFQMTFPEIMLIGERLLSPILEFFCKLFRLRDPVHRVPFSFRFPGEEEAALTTSSSPFGSYWGYLFPVAMRRFYRQYAFFDGASSEEMHAWKQAFLFLVKKISHANHNKQLVLKSPPNTARIGLLLSLFPNARFIFIHRNPYKVYASNQNFLQVALAQYGLGKLPIEDLNTLILDTYSEMMHRYLKEKVLIPDGHLFELAYDDFISQPVACLEEAYRKLRLPDFHVCKEHMQTFAARQRKFRRLEHHLADDEAAMVMNKLEPFFNLWHYAEQPARQPVIQHQNPS